MRRCLMLALVLIAGCATPNKTQVPQTTKTQKSPFKVVRSISDLNVGDVVPFTDPRLRGCFIKVGNLITLKPTPLGIVSTPPEVCGPFQCRKGDKPQVNCFFIQAFLARPMK